MDFLLKSIGEKFVLFFFKNLPPKICFFQKFIILKIYFIYLVERGQIERERERYIESGLANNHI